MTTTNTPDGLLIFPSAVTGDGGTAALNQWTMITEDAVFLVQPNGYSVHEPRVYQRTGAEIVQDKPPVTQVEISHEDGSTETLFVKDTGGCGCSNPLKGVRTIAQVQALRSKTLQRQQAEQARNARRAEQRKASRLKREQRAVSRRASLAARSKSAKRRSTK